MGHQAVAASHPPNDTDVVKSVAPVDYKEVLHHDETAPIENTAEHATQCLLTCKQRNTIKIDDMFVKPTNCAHGYFWVEYYIH